MLKIKNITLKPKIVKTKEDTINGMAFKIFNNDFNSMLFILEGNKHCFWMKNCIIPLDIIFIEKNKIVKIFHNCKPCTNTKCQQYCSNGDTVLEVAGGFCVKNEIKEGDQVDF